jgi:hypothetical protein
MNKTQSRKDPFEDCPTGYSVQPGMCVKFMKGIYLKKSDPIVDLNGTVVMERYHTGPHVDEFIYKVISLAEKDTGIFLILQECLSGNTIAVARDLIGYFQYEVNSIRTISPVEKKRKMQRDDISSETLSALSVSSFTTRDQDIEACFKEDEQVVAFSDDHLSLSHDSKGLLSEILPTETSVGEEWRVAVAGYKIVTKTSEEKIKARKKC